MNVKGEQTRHNLQGTALVHANNKVVAVHGKNVQTGETTAICYSNTEIVPQDWQQERVFARQFHTICLDTISNTFWMFGGKYQNVAFDDVAKMNLGQNLIALIPQKCSGAIPPARYGHVAQIYKQQLFVVSGAKDENYLHNDCFALNLQTLVWQQVQFSVPICRLFAASCLIGSKMYISGGLNEKAEAQGDMFVLDLETFHVEQCTWVFEKRYGHAMVSYKNDVYCIGGTMNDHCTVFPHVMKHVQQSGWKIVVIPDNIAWQEHTRFIAVNENTIVVVGKPSSSIKLVGIKGNLQAIHEIMDEGLVHYILHYCDLRTKNALVATSSSMTLCKLARKDEYWSSYVNGFHFTPKQTNIRFEFASNCKTTFPKHVPSLAFSKYRQIVNMPPENFAVNPCIAAQDIPFNVCIPI